ncbi:hypothetical protein [Bradyrhizobium iriomotense]|uniref:hypothetical protein n=1 Tax=Bradyrhizobium iriomotense TaxID=441950 RepID=UPI0024E0E75A|nr:hypothetical protein [Bradyrhizobium iriomotense]
MPRIERQTSAGQRTGNRHAILLAISSRQRAAADEILAFMRAGKNRLPVVVVQRTKADVFFEEHSLRYLMMDDAANAATVAPFGPSMEGAGVILSDDSLISEIRLRQTGASLLCGPPLFKTMGLIRFSSSALRTTLAPELDTLIGSGSINAYTEESLAHLIEKRGFRFAAVRCDEQRWVRNRQRGRPKDCRKAISNRSPSTAVKRMAVGVWASVLGASNGRLSA